LAHDAPRRDSVWAANGCRCLRQRGRQGSTARIEETPDAALIIREGDTEREIILI